MAQVLIGINTVLKLLHIVQNHLQQAQSVLCSYFPTQTRYERVSGESDDRMQQLNTSVDELSKFDREFSSFEGWLRAAERTLDSYLMDIARDRDGLQKQVSKLQPFNEDVVSHSADLRFINMSGKRFLEETKVSDLFVCLLLLLLFFF